MYWHVSHKTMTCWCTHIFMTSYVFQVRWETGAPGGPRHEDLKVSQEFPDFLVSQFCISNVPFYLKGSESVCCNNQTSLNVFNVTVVLNRSPQKMRTNPSYRATSIVTRMLCSQVSRANWATVRTVGTAREDLLAFLDSRVYPGLPATPVPTVTATRRRATSRQGRPTSLWMWRGLQGTKGHSGIDRLTVGLALPGTHQFSVSFPGPLGRVGPPPVSLSSCEHVLCRPLLRHQPARKKNNIFFLLCCQNIASSCFSPPRDVFTLQEAVLTFMRRKDQRCLFIPLSLLPLPASIFYAHHLQGSSIKAPPLSLRTFWITT